MSFALKNNQKEIIYFGIVSLIVVFSTQSLKYLELSSAILLGIIMGAITAAYFKFLHPKLKKIDNRGILFTHGVSSLVGVLANLFYFIFHDD